MTATDSRPDHDSATLLGLGSSEVLGPNVPERRECDAPVCPWCDREGWDTCQHADEAKSCHR